MSTNFDRAELRAVAEEAAQKAVTHTLIMLGIEVSDPIKAQRDFAALRELRELVDDGDFQADLKHLRTWRIAVEQAKRKGFLTLVGALVTGAAGLMLVGAKGWFGGGH